MEVLTDSAIQAAHPQFQTPLREYNDSIRLLVERIQREAQKRMMPTPGPLGHLVRTLQNRHFGDGTVEKEVEG